MTVKGQNIDVMRRDDRRAGTFERCEVIAVKPYTKPSDPWENFVDIQFIDRPYDLEKRPITREDVPIAQRLHGKYQGTPWTPRIGDMVIIAWLKDDVAVVIATIPSLEQPPVCRSKATDEDQEVVRKLCPWEAPEQDEKGNYIIFKNPKHPDCFKWWPKTRDSIYVFDCKNGHDCAQCDRTAPCNLLDDIKARTWFKNFSDISNTETDEKWRFKFHHNSGSVAIWDNDGTFHLENKTNCVTCGGSGCSGTCPTCKGTRLVDDETCPACGGCGQSACKTCSGLDEGKAHTHFYPDGNIDWHAGNPHPNKCFPLLTEETHGVRVACIHPDSTLAVDWNFEAIDFQTGAYIRFMKDGEVVIHSPKKITLDADLVEETKDNLTSGNNEIKGTCKHGSCSCPCGGAGGSCYR